MAKKEKVEVVEEVVEKQAETAAEEVQPQEQPEVVNEVVDDNVIKVDLGAIKQEAEKVEEDAPTVETEKVVEEVVEEEEEEEEEEVVEEEKEEAQPVLEEITEEEVEEEVVAEEPVTTEEKTKEAMLPENIQKVLDFMNDTGGTLEDYVELNKDFSKLSDNDLLSEYFKKTKPHLTEEEVAFVIEDLYSYDEDLDEDIEIKRKKLALKEQVANAKQYLQDKKTTYYEEIKAGSKLTPDQQKAVEFFNRYNKETEETAKAAEQQKKVFLTKTDEVFSSKFKGFEYEVGEKKYRFNVNNASEVKTKQSDINNFVKKFLDENNNIKDAKGYHKSLFTAMNADAIANHFYEQGKADGLKSSIARAKNIDMNPRTAHKPATTPGGIKVRAISGNDSSQLKVKIKQ